MTIQRIACIHKSPNSLTEVTVFVCVCVFKCALLVLRHCIDAFFNAVLFFL